MYNNKTNLIFKSLNIVLIIIIITVLFTTTITFAERTINFSGYVWNVKASSNPVGPGPNNFSDSEKNVWVDNSGKLHLVITSDAENWSCAEVICNQSLGYGKYLFSINNTANELDPNIVLGLFTWDDNSEFHHREIDIEVSKWGIVDNNNTQYVVQPYDYPGNMLRFMNLYKTGNTLHEFNWSENKIIFSSIYQNNDNSSDNISLINNWEYSSPLIPIPGIENPRINLWLFNGLPPNNKKDSEVIITNFSFTP